MDPLSRFPCQRQKKGTWMSEEGQLDCRVALPVFHCPCIIHPLSIIVVVSMAVNSCRRASSIKKSIFNRLSRHNAKVHRRGPRCQPTKGSRRKLRCFVHLAYALSHAYRYQHVIYIQLNHRVIGRVLDTLAILKDPCLYYCIFL